MIREGRVLVSRSGEEKPFRQASDRVPARAEVVLLVPHPRVPVAPPVITEVPVLYEDDVLLAVDKPPLLPVHPSGRYLYDTLISILYRKYRRPEDPTRDVVPRLLHRIDRETSGIVLVSKDERAHARVARQFEKREIEKEYAALVHGEVERDAGRIDLPLAPAGGQIRVKVTARRDGAGTPALTLFRVERRYRGFTLVAAEPKTGRQHQIRAHLAAVGHPIVGDKIYGADETLFLKGLSASLDEDDRAILLLERQALHASRLRFRHPTSGEPVEIRAPLPRDMADFAARLEPR